MINVASRRHSLDLSTLRKPVVLICNASAGQKLGMITNASGTEAATAALEAAGVPHEVWPTERAGHATELARKAVEEGRELVIAAGGDGTVAEVANGLAGSETVLGVMPMGSIMNVARTLCLPRDLHKAAETIARGDILSMDLGRVRDRYFLEAGGVGVDAGLFSFFNRADKGRMTVPGALRGALRFLRALGRPRLTIVVDGTRMQVRAPLVVVANGPYVGAAYAVAPDARIDDGLLDVVIFHGASVPRVMLHLLAVAGGRSLPPPPRSRQLRARSVEIASRRRRGLPAHADGNSAGRTPVHFECVPGALRVLVGTPAPQATCAWVSTDPGYDVSRTA